MSEHHAAIDWKRSSAEFTYETYNRAHVWRFEGGIEVPASAAPEYRGDVDRVDPERAFVAALSSCHMLTFLAIAAKKRFVVDSYRDDAVGIMEKNAQGKLAITRLTLRPKIAFSGDRKPSADELSVMHEQSHEHCFIANSVRTEVRVEPA